MGTALLARGLPAGVSPERWLVERLEEVARVHTEHAAAGAEVIITCSFNLASNRVDGREVPDLAARAVEVARRAAPGRVVAAGVGPSGLWSPATAPPDAAAVAALYSRAFSALARAGADLLWAESLYSAAEARVALRCALEVGRPAVTTVVYAGAPGGRATLPDGAPADELLEELAATGAAAVGVNCVLPGAPGLSPLLSRVVKRVAVPLVAKPSAGLPGHVMTPAAFGAWCSALREAGASWIGGCCGASADHVAAAARAVHAG